MEINQKLTLTILTLVGSFSLLSCVQPGDLELTSHPAESRVMSSPPVNPPVIEPMKVTPPEAPDLIKINRQAKIQVAARQKVDVLFVDDDSKSMLSVQKRMGQKFNNFIDTLEGLDWQVAITTTDVEQYKDGMRTKRFRTQEDIRKNIKIPMVKAIGNDGRFLQFPNGQYILNSSLSRKEAQDQFAKTIQRPSEEGSQYEQGIKAVYRSIERIDEHATFFRPDASLAIVFISDADESPSTGIPEESNLPSALVSLMQKTFGEKKVIFHSIVVPADDKTCLNEKDEKGIARHEAYGLSYIELSQQTNGVVGSVCAADYAKQLQFMGEKVQQVIHAWKLECTGAQDLALTNNQGQAVPVTMTVDGNVVHFSQSLPEGEYNLNYTCLIPR